MRYQKLKKVNHPACICVFAGILWCLILLTAAGCSSREAQFLESTGSQTEEAADGENPETEEDTETAPDEEASAQSETTIYVDVCGAVIRPGVYELQSDSRIFQAIDAAGGLLPEAAAECANRAGFLSDGQQIYIPTREEAEAGLQESAVQGEMEPSEGSVDSGSGNTNEKINLNTADETALTSLTGIGASKAQAILAYREEHGGFAAVEEILNVPGIKEGTFAKIKDRISVE